MLKRFILPLLLLLVSVSACTQTPTAIPTSGIEGRATEGPMCPGPVRVGDNSCPDQPYQANIIVLDSDNNKITQIQADANGYFIIPLDPGTYTLHPEPGKPFPIAADQTVVVTVGQYTQVSILYDTGMR